MHQCNQSQRLGRSERVRLTSLVILAASMPALGAEIQPPVNVPQVPTTWKTDWYVEDEFIVVFTPDVRGQIEVKLDAERRPVSGVAAIDASLRIVGARKLERLFRMAKPEPPMSNRPDLTGYYRIQVPAGANLDTALQTMKNNPNVAAVEKIGVHAVYAAPNDTQYATQWHYQNNFSVFADDAWDYNTGDPSVVVGIADTGVQYFHLDLGGPNAAWGPDNPQTNGNIFVNPDEIPGDGLNNDSNDYIDDTIGYDFVASTVIAGCTCIDADCGTADNDPDDFEGHGTHVAGTVAAINNNARNVAGVAGGWSDGTTSGAGNGAKILPLRIGWDADCTAGGGSVGGIVRMDYAAEAIVYAGTLVDDGVNVTAINCSWSSSNPGGVLGAAVDFAFARDIMVIHAAGNDSDDTADYLGARAGVMNVAATTSTGNPASFTNFGPWVDVAAPGNSILSTSNTNGTAFSSGTSMAAPHVAGVAALLESCAPSLTGPEKFDLLVEWTRPYGGSLDLGSGIVNAYDAMRAAQCAPCLSDTECDDDLYCNGAEFCDAGVCTNGPAIDCDDQFACTTDTCNEVADACQHFVESLVYEATVNGAIVDNGGFGNQLMHTINVPDSLIMDDVDIMVDIDHTFQGNLRVVVTHNGTAQVMMNRPGPTGFGCGADNFQSIILDDEGIGGTIDAQCTGNLTSPPNYVPDEPLSAFDGTDVAGDWTITVSDHAVANVGTLVSWGVYVRGPALIPELCGAPDAPVPNPAGKCAPAYSADCNTETQNCAGSPKVCSGSPLTACADNAGCVLPGQTCIDACVPWTMNRYLSFSVPTTSAGQDTALRVRLTSLHHPVAPLPSGGVPSFAALEGQYRYVNKVPGALNRCCNPASNPTTCHPSATCAADGDCSALGSNSHCQTNICPDSAVFNTFFRCVRLGCTAEYTDWATEFEGGDMYVYGDTVITDSTYEVSHLAASCAGNEASCPAASLEMEVRTARWGNVDGSGGGPAGPAAPDIGRVTSKVGSALGSYIEPRVQLREATPTPLTAAVNAQDIGRVVDAVQGKAYPFRFDCTPNGPCDKSCDGDAFCSTNGFCTHIADACGYCQP